MARVAVPDRLQFAPEMAVQQTGEAARHWLTERDARLREAAATLKSSPDEVPARIASLVEERKRLERELDLAKKKSGKGV